MEAKGHKMAGARVLVAAVLLASLMCSHSSVISSSSGGHGQVICRAANEPLTMFSQSQRRQLSIKGCMFSIGS